MKYLCAADLHLGAGPDYGRDPGDRLADQEKVWQQVCELAAEHDVDALLFAGDAFHRRRPIPAEILAFIRPLRWLRKEAPQIDAVAILGNHDVEAAGLPTALDLCDNLIDVAREPRIWRGNIACLPWTPVSQLVALRGGGDRDETHEHAAALLVDIAAQLRGQIDGPATLLLHWSVSGARTSTGAQTDEFREPVIPYGALEQLGYQAIVAGHIHLPQYLGGTGFYPGSPCVVDFGEASHEHGVRLLELDRGAVVSSSFIEIADRPFVTIDVEGPPTEDDPTGGATHNLIVDELEQRDLHGAVVRIRYRATEKQARLVDHPTLRTVALEAGAHKVYAIQPEILRENRARVAAADETLSAHDALSMWGAANNVAAGELERLGALTTDYLGEIA